MHKEYSGKGSLMQNIIQQMDKSLLKRCSITWKHCTRSGTNIDSWTVSTRDKYKMIYEFK